MSALLRIVAGGLLAALVAVSVLLTAPTAKAHMSKCGERRDIIDQLEKRYDEKRAVFGLTSNGRLIEVFVGSSGSWTMLTSDPTGIACVLGSGEGWRPVATPQDEPVA
jgi:hypothetical protein